ncbi:MAG: hypothetical protein L6Q37_05955 [Bdellovibrionaceae bacterium]|nr:hypothetical protein [Pseudobdellovibrionaceae bacterium]NUM58660.1 hypothetical protein [Pseudobdellovibrionaceae bacterium]
MVVNRVELPLKHFELTLKKPRDINLIINLISPAAIPKLHSSDNISAIVLLSVPSGKADHLCISSAILNAN